MLGKLLAHWDGILKNSSTLVPAAVRMAKLWRMYRQAVKLDLQGQSMGELFTNDASELIDVETAHRFESHLKHALTAFAGWRKGFLGMMLKYGKKLAHKQLLMQYNGYQPVETIVALLAAVTAASKAAKAGDQSTVNALDLQCELLRCKLSHTEPTSPRIAQLMDIVYDDVISGRFHQLHGTTVYPMLQPAVDRAMFDAIMDGGIGGASFTYPVSQESFPYDEWLEHRNGKHGFGPLEEREERFFMEPPRQFG